MEVTHEWCSAIYANREKFEDWKSLTLTCLEIGFRRLDPQFLYLATLTHTEHHRQLVDVVFESRNGEVVADFLHSWAVGYQLPEQASGMVGACMGHLVGLHNQGPFSPRLRRIVIRLVESSGYEEFKGAGVEKLIVLLDHLHVTDEDIDTKDRWASLLLNVIWSSGGTQLLSHWYWEFLAELAFLEMQWLKSQVIHGPEITKTLVDAEEWEKLECWIKIIWICLDSAGITEEDIKISMLSLFRHRPGAAQRLEQWMERWSQQYKENIPEPFQRILTQVHEAVQRQAIT